MTDRPRAFPHGDMASHEPLTEPPLADKEAFAQSGGDVSSEARLNEQAESGALPGDSGLLAREIQEAMSEAGDGALGSLKAGFPSAADLEAVTPNTELVGTVVAVSEDDIFLEFGVKSQGVLPRSQFGKKERIEVGRRVDVIVERIDQESGLLIVSRKGALQRATWTNLAAGMLIEGRVTGVIKGGLEVDVKGIRAFMPASHADLIPMRDISELLNQVVRCEVLEVDRRHKNVLLSRRKAMERELVESRKRLWEELAEGQVRQGVVKTITEYGAFVDLGGVDGLLHIRDLSWGTVAKVEDVVTPGNRIEVTVLKIDKPKERISLGLKQSQPNPWDQVPSRYPVGTFLKARIIRLANFGAFAELEAGVEGLIPLSEMGWSRLRRPGDAVAEGDMVDCVVIRLEPEKQRLALSIKQVAPDPWAGVLASFPAQSLVKGKITRITDFGAFVELVPGVEGLIHISEMADHRVKSCDEVVQVDQDVEMRVLGVDEEHRRISLSIKAVRETPDVEALDAERADAQRSKPKTKKKPRRGGLSSHFEW